MPLLTMYRFGIYGFSFLLGYFVFSHEKVQELVEKIHISMLILAVAFGVCYTAQYFGKDFTTPACLQSLFTNVYSWIAVIAVLGRGKAWLNRKTKFTPYMTRASFGLFIIHYPVVMVVCYLLTYYCNLPMLLNYAIALIAELALTPLIYELFKRIPAVRYLVLGIKKQKK